VKQSMKPHSLAHLRFLVFQVLSTSTQSLAYCCTRWSKPL